VLALPAGSVDHAPVIFTHGTGLVSWRQRVIASAAIFGVRALWTGGRKEAPTALCRKIAMAPNKESIEGRNRT
jgi:hypothetical protein